MNKIFTLILALIVVQANAQVTVGWDNTCDYDESQTAGQIQQAIDDGNTEIRVTNQQEFVMPFTINDTVTISGGYNSCTDANNNIQSQDMTVINGSTFTQVAIHINTNLAVRDINLESIEIKNSQNGAMSVLNSSGDINLTRLNIHDSINTQFIGGGLDLKNDQIPAGSPLTVNLIDVLILNNTTQSNGGGINCETAGSIHLNISGNSGVSFNHSDANGGGISLIHCTLDFSSGTSSPSLSNPLGIHNNTANSSGGGLYIFEASEVTLTGNQTAPVNITENTSNFDGVSSGDGGGVAVRGVSAANQSILNATDVLISANTSQSSRYGGGVYVDFDAVANISSHFRNCSWSPLCSLIENNIANNGGAINVEERGHVNITGTEIKGNRVKSSGSVARLSGDDSELVFEGSLIHHNGGSDHTNFSDFYLIRNSLGSNSITVAYSTIVDNQAQFASINSHSGTAGNLQLFASIIDDPGVSAVSVTPGALLGEANCNILTNSTSITNLPISNNIIETTPAFIDRANRDYHLDPSLSVAIDRCESSIYAISSDDIDGNIRGYDHPDFVNNTGQFDIGVDEVSSENIFKDSFE